MKQSLTDTIFSIHRNTPGEATPEFTRSTAKELGLNERWFQDVIASEPEIVVNPCRAAGLTDESWFSWGTEVNVPGIGPIDILLVSSAGRVGIVETKLAHSPENRRKILAQVLDYAINLPSMTVENLPQLPDDVDEEDVEQGLSNGDFLLILATDCADERAVRLSDALLGDHMVNPWDLVMVDVVPYVPVGGTNDKIMLVGSLRRAVVAEPRHIVRVEIDSQDGPPNVIVKPIASGGRTVSTGRRMPRSEALEQLSQTLGSEIAKRVEEMIQQLTQPPHLLIEHMTGQKLRLRYNAKGEGLPCKAFHLLEVYPSGYIGGPWIRLAKLGVDPNEIESYFELLRSIHPRLAPRLGADGTYAGYKGTNSAPIGEIAERLPEIAKIIIDISAWLDGVITR
jgi:hypothetical protein